MIRQFLLNITSVLKGMKKTLLGILSRFPRQTLHVFYVGYILLAAAASMWIVSKQQSDLLVHGCRVGFQRESYTSLFLRQLRHQRLAF